MSPAIINLLVQLISGAIGGNAAGKVNPSFNLGALVNTIVGAVGGVGGGWLISTLAPALAAAEGAGIDVAGIATQAVGGGVAGLVLTAIIGAIKNKASA
jgi:uncharacterized membrane protein YeaQ/YmgE (transglycosylase-associated protein family)